MGKKKNIKEYDDPKQIFMLAECFFSASYILQDNFNPTDPRFKYFHKYLFATANTNHAFSCELYLKCLLCIENGEYEAIHPLDILFLSLSKETQYRIKELHDDIAAKNKITRAAESTGIIFNKDMYIRLQDASLAFLNFRYHFDRSIEDFNKYHLGDFIQALRKVIIEKHPDWPQW